MEITLDQPETELKDVSPERHHKRDQDFYCEDCWNSGNCLCDCGTVLREHQMVDHMCDTCSYVTHKM